MRSKEGKKKRKIKWLPTIKLDCKSENCNENNIFIEMRDKWQKKK